MYVIAVKYTKEGSITVKCTPLSEEQGGLRWPGATAVEIVVADTGCGIPPRKLESIFREFEQVESSEPKTTSEAGVGEYQLLICSVTSAHYQLQAWDSPSWHELSSN